MTQNEQDVSEQVEAAISTVNGRFNTWNPTEAMLGYARAVARAALSTLPRTKGEPWEIVAWAYEPTEDCPGLEKAFVQPARANMDKRYWTETPLYTHPAQPSASAGELADELEELHGLIGDQIELNPSNYDHDDACDLNAQAVQIALKAKDLLPRILTTLRQQPPADVEAVLREARDELAGAQENILELFTDGLGVKREFAEKMPSVKAITALLARIDTILPQEADNGEG